MYTSVMNKTKKELHKDRHIAKKIAIDVAGFGLMIIAPFLGWLPGPGGIPLFLAGLGLVSLNHEWAENLLKDFDRIRTDLTDKYLMTSPRVSITIDIMCISLLSGGAYLSITQDHLLLRGLGLALASLSFIILISNQKRFERITAFLKKK